MLYKINNFYDTGANKNSLNRAKRYSVTYAIENRS